MAPGADPISCEEGTARVLDLRTAWHTPVTRPRVRPGETVPVPAADDRPPGVDTVFPLRLARRPQRYLQDRTVFGHVGPEPEHD